MYRVLIKGIVSGTIAVPIAVLIQSLVYALLKGKPSFADFGDLASGIIAWSVGGVVVTLIALSLYGLPLFLLCRKLRLANIFSCLFFALLPSASLAISTGEAIYFYQYGYLSVVCALGFWFFARRVALQPNNRFNSDAGKARAG